MMAAEDSDNARRRHDMLSSLAETTAAYLMGRQGADHALSMTTEQAADIGNAVADFVATHSAGQHVYFVKDEAFHLDARDRKICAAMERGKAVDVAAQFGLSYVRVHQIYRRYLQELQARAKAAQPDMFALPPATGDSNSTVESAW